MLPGRGRRRRTALPVLTLALLAVATKSGGAQDSPLGRWTPGGYTEAYVVAKTESDSPNQRPSGIIDLNLSGEFGHSLRLYADVLSTFGGTPVDPSGGGVIDPRFAFQNLSPVVEFQEAYADVYLGHLDLRLGMQKFAWGRLDTFNPTDVLNPRRYTDPFVLRESDLKVGLPAVRASYFLESSSYVDTPSVTAIWVPFPVSFHFPLADQRWFPPAASVPPDVVIPPGFLAPGLPGTTVQSTLETINDPAAWQLKNGSGALRLAGVSGGADWSLVYYDGPETAPAFDFDTSVVSPSAQEKIAHGQTPTIQDLTQLDATAQLEPRFGRIHLVGGDAAYSFAGFTARAEVGMGFDRLVPRSTTELLSLDNIGNAVRPQLPQILSALLAGQSVAVDLGPLFERRNVFEWGAGIDYAIDGWVPVLQINQSVVLDNDVTLLVPNVDTRLLAALRRSFFDDRLATEVVGVQGFERSYTTLQLRATYSFTDFFTVRAGYLFIAGTSNSVIGEYGANDEFFFQGRYSF